MSERALQVYRNPNAAARSESFLPAGPAPMTAEMVETITRTIAKDATPEELAIFLHQCNRTGLDPLTRQIYFVKPKNGRAVIIIAIDGFRLIAERTGQYRGMTEPQWCGPDGQWTDIWLREEPPAACRVGVLRAGFEAPVVGTALFREFAQMRDGQPVDMWRKMPAHMLQKCATCQALRAAFPNELSGTYSEVEMAQAQNAPAPRGARMTTTPAVQLGNGRQQHAQQGKAPWPGWAVWGELAEALGIPKGAETRRSVWSGMLDRKIVEDSDVRPEERQRLIDLMREATVKALNDQAEARAQQAAQEADGEETVHESEIVGEAGGDVSDDPFQDA